MEWNNPLGGKPIFLLCYWTMNYGRVRGMLSYEKKQIPMKH